MNQITARTIKMAVALLTAVLGVAMFASSTAGAAGPPPEVFDDQDQAWLCFGDPESPTPANHCLNANSKGDTGLVMVFEPDERGPAEGISVNPASNDRPCPHDDQEGDGTWWEFAEGLWVCHHKPSTPPGQG